MRYGLHGILLAALLGVWITVPSVYAQVTSDQPAALLVFPKVVVDTTDPPSTPRGPIDTLVRISNTSDQPITLHCFYVNANGHCPNAPATICDPYTRGAPNPCGDGFRCEPGWQESNFVVHLTARQPVAWLASEGARLCDQNGGSTAPCFPLNNSRLGFNGQTNEESLVPPVPEDPFIGELKCIAVDRNEVPVERNHLKGEAQIVRSNPDFVDVASYNAIGIPAIAGRNDGDNVLVMGGRQCVGGDNDGALCSSNFECRGGACVDMGEYEGCPNIIIMDHFLDGANDPVSGDTISSTLTLVPCSDDFATQSPVQITVQFLVFNEFEQRLSTSRSVTCFREFRLSDIDNAGEFRSIFSAAVLGTLTGQTRLRGVETADTQYGRTLLGVVEEFRSGGGTSAFNLHFHGSRPQSDFLYLP